MVFQTGLALLSLHEKELMSLSFEDLLTALSGKRFASLTESPDLLLQTALSFEYVGPRCIADVCTCVVHHSVGKRLEELAASYAAMQTQSPQHVAYNTGVTHP